MTNLGGAVISNNNTQTGLNNGVLTTGMGTILGQQAAAEAKREYDENPGGIMGTGILGKNGLLGLKGVPIL